MTETDVAKLIARLLPATKAAAELAKSRISEVQEAATDVELVSAFQGVGEIYDGWIKRVDDAIAKAGTAGSGDPTVLRAIFDAGREIRQAAADGTSRDLEIIQNARLGLHTWIVSFDVLQTYAAQAGMDQIELDMRASLEDATNLEAKHVAIAKRLLTAST